MTHSTCEGDLLFRCGAMHCAGVELEIILYCS